MSSQTYTKAQLDLLLAALQPAGVALLAAQNLTDLANPAAARTALGLGTAATADISQLAPFTWALDTDGVPYFAATVPGGGTTTPGGGTTNPGGGTTTTSLLTENGAELTTESGDVLVIA